MHNAVHESNWDRDVPSTPGWTKGCHEMHCCRHTSRTPAMGDPIVASGYTWKTKRAVVLYNRELHMVSLGIDDLLKSATNPLTVPKKPFGKAVMIQYKDRFLHAGSLRVLDIPDDAILLCDKESVAHARLIHEAQQRGFNRASLCAAAAASAASAASVNEFPPPPPPPVPGGDPPAAAAVDDTATTLERKRKNPCSAEPAEQ